MSQARRNRSRRLRARRRRKAGVQVVDYETYFYPLDGILQWNRLYGRRGFVQYQCVFPLKTSVKGMRLMLEEAMGFERFYSAYTYMKEVCVRGREGESARERVRE